MSAMKTAVCLIKTTADGSEVEESFYVGEIEAVRALDIDLRGCGWSRTAFIAGDAIIYEHAPYPDEFDVIGIAQLRMLGY